MNHFSTVLILGAIGLASAASAAPLVTVVNGTAVQAEAAFVDWQSGVSSFSVDQLTGLAGTSSSRTSPTSKAAR